MFQNHKNKSTTEWLKKKPHGAIEWNRKHRQDSIQLKMHELGQNAKNAQCRKESIFNTWCLENWI